MTKWIFILLLLSGCVTQKRCLDKFPPDTVTVTHDTTIFKDTMVFRKIKGDTVYIERILYHYMPSEHTPIKRNYEPILLQTALCVARSYIAGNRIKMSLVQKDSVFQFKLDSAIRANKKVVIKTKIVEKPIPPNPFWRNGFFVVGAILILLLVFLVWRK